MLVWGLSMPTPRTPVCGLFFVGSPFAIVRRITTRVVYSLKGQTIRLTPRIGKESVKRIPPAITNSNTATSISFKGAVLRIMASSVHIEPRLVCGRSRHTMSFHAATYPLAVQASARGRAPARETVLNKSPRGAALTNAVPHSERLLSTVLQCGPSRLSFTDNGQPTKDLISKIDCSSFTARHWFFSIVEKLMIRAVESYNFLRPVLFYHGIAT